MDAKIRLYVRNQLCEALIISLERNQANYLFAVMRQAIGKQILIFNNCDGEWLAEIIDGNKRFVKLKCLTKIRPSTVPPNVWLYFSPIKKSRTDFIVEKATELGVAEIFPTRSEYTNSERINRDRLQAHAIEAAEQCGGTYVPKVHKICKLIDTLEKWPNDRKIFFCNEDNLKPTGNLSELPKGAWAIFIGPEGGFSKKEKNHFMKHPKTFSVSLGPRILRADTAAISALTLWQSHLGDWTENFN
jgi:16S rRNA (uracil1498-N3)-methyltransferase